MPELPGGTLTVLHTDVEDSTLLTVHLGNRYPEILAVHRALLRTAFAAHEGREVDTQGDAIFVVFGRATQAIAAAVAIQRALVPRPGRRAGPCGCASASTRENRGTHTFKGLPGVELTVHSTRFLRARTAVLCGPQLTGHVRRTRSCR